MNLFALKFIAFFEFVLEDNFFMSQILYLTILFHDLEQISFDFT